MQISLSWPGMYHLILFLDLYFKSYHTLKFVHLLVPRYLPTTLPTHIYWNVGPFYTSLPSYQCPHFIHTTPGSYSFSPLQVCFFSQTIFSTILHEFFLAQGNFWFPPRPIHSKSAPQAVTAIFLPILPFPPSKWLILHPFTKTDGVGKSCSIVLVAYPLPQRNNSKLYYLQLPPLPSHLATTPIFNRSHPNRL